MKAISLILVSLLTACTSQGMYESIKQNQCLETTGNMYCEEVENYDDYQRKREELLKEETNK